MLLQVATSETARDINRLTVLNLIRTRQPISRADLSRASGLQRSTISLIVEQLIHEGWVLEGSTSRLPRGRHPTSLSLNSERVIVGIDIRPTQIEVALSDINGRFLAHESLPTPADSRLAIQQLVAAVRRLAAAANGKHVDGIGISVPGRLDPDGARLIFAPNLSWGTLDLRDPIAAGTGFDVELENAANACALSAVWFDQVRERNVLALTVSEGIGAGLLANGELIRGLHGMAGEFGHIILDPSGPECGCGNHGCWEVFASNRAALRYYREQAPDAPPATYSDLLDRAAQSDAAARAALEKQAAALARGLRLIVAGLAPERILVVGDLTRSWDLFQPVLDAGLRQRALPGSAVPVLEPARDHANARLRGTVALVLQKHFHYPYSDAKL